MKEVAGTLKRRFANIITYLKHRITNATSESINAKIQWVKYTARGFRNKQNFINAIYFHCGGLDLARQPLNRRKRLTFICPCNTHVSPSSMLGAASMQRSGLACPTRVSQDFQSGTPQTGGTPSKPPFWKL